MPLTLTVLNHTKGTSVLVAEGGSTGSIDIQDGNTIGYWGIGANPNKKVDLQRSPDGSAWTTWQSVNANSVGDYSFLDETMPTPAPATHYRRTISRTV